MDLEKFQNLIAEVTTKIAGKPLDSNLQKFLEDEVPADGELFQMIQSACHQAVAEGWMCEREYGGIRFGRVIAPAKATDNFSVDVVQMENIVGPHHVHTNGEVDMIMPLQGDAKFDGQSEGWLVFPPGSAHKPTVTDGSAFVLYLLPEGAIEFTR